MLKKTQSDLLISRSRKKLMCLLGAMFLIASVSGCVASNVLVDQAYSAAPGERFEILFEDEAEMPEEASRLLERTIKSSLKSNDYQVAEGGTKMMVTVTKYRFRSDATRVLTGNVTGSDAIVSEIRIHDASSGELLGSERIVTQNPTVVSTVEDLFQGHADKIVSSLAP